MPQSLAKVNVHIVFTTKYGQQFITDELRPELHSYIIGVLSKVHSYTYELYANPDHIHILCTLSRTITMADLVAKSFYWQDGYGIFSVSASKIAAVRKYIKNQPNHHKEVDYKDEFRLFLHENGIEYDERYVWD